MYEVIVIEISLKNGKVAKFGEKVSEGQLTRNPSDLIKEKYIKKVGDKETKSAPKTKK